MTADERRRIETNIAAQVAYVQTPEGRRESAIDIMASWGLDGLQPSPRALSDIRDYVVGRLTIEEMIANVKAEYERPQGASETEHDT